MAIHYTQSPAYRKFMFQIGWKVIPVTDTVAAYSKSTPFFGRSIFKIPRAPLKLPYAHIDILAKKEHALFIKIEPDVYQNENESRNFLRQNRYYPDHFPICQSKTILVDITMDEKKLLASLRQETRHHLKKSYQEGYTLTSQKNDHSKQSESAFKEFYALFVKCAKERKFYSPFETQMHILWDCFGKDAHILLAKKSPQSEPLSGTLLLSHDHKIYYKYGASVPSGREHFSSYFLYWEMLLYAKNLGFPTFDLEGIQDLRYHRPQKYKGLTQFKKGWSKNEITYIGPYTKYFNPIISMILR